LRSSVINPQMIRQASMRGNNQGLIFPQRKESMLLKRRNLTFGQNVVHEETTSPPNGQGTSVRPLQSNTNITDFSGASENDQSKARQTDTKGAVSQPQSPQIKQQPPVSPVSVRSNSRPKVSNSPPKMLLQETIDFCKNFNQF
jgi:hypothetical protein